MQTYITMHNDTKLYMNQNIHEFPGTNVPFYIIQKCSEYIIQLTNPNV